MFPSFVFSLRFSPQRYRNPWHLYLHGTRLNRQIRRSYLLYLIAPDPAVAESTRAPSVTRRAYPLIILGSTRCRVRSERFSRIRKWTRHSTDDSKPNSFPRESDTYVSFSRIRLSLIVSKISCEYLRRFHNTYTHTHSHTHIHIYTYEKYIHIYKKIYIYTRTELYTYVSSIRALRTYAMRASCCAHLRNLLARLPRVSQSTPILSFSLSSFHFGAFPLDSA